MEETIPPSDKQEALQMNYKEASYKEKEAFFATLKPSQKAKFRKMQKDFKEQLSPINNASHARQEQVRKEAWATLKTTERMTAVEESYEPRLKALRESLQAIQTEISEILDEKAEVRSKIHQEPYTLAYEDAEVKAMRAIYSQMLEAQEIKFQKLIDSFEVKVDA